MIFETERLILRPWREEDAQALYQYASDPEIGPAAGWPVHTSVEDSREVIRTVLSAEGTFAVCLNGRDCEPVGSIGSFSRERVPEGPEVGYWIGRPFWGNGYIPEAVFGLLDHLFEADGCRRVWCSHFVQNEKSRRVIQKCGFRPEFLRETEWPAAGKVIEQFYSLRRSEYLSRRGRLG